MRHQPPLHLGARGLMVRGSSDDDAAAAHRLCPRSTGSADHPRRWLFRMCVLTGKALFRVPFQWREFILQCWFIMRVGILPTIAVSIPLTVLLIFTLNVLLAQAGPPTSPGRCGDRCGHPTGSAHHGVGGGRCGFDRDLR
ncbi:putative conserved membrane protein [Mycobacterium xenopi 3993]|nr:putative conserved membrane protein [Mycobacterium xenopi 3993]